MAVGITGAFANNSRYIGDFQLICAPLSSLSYTENWRFLSTKGAALPYFNSLLRGFTGWALLSQNMHRVYLQDLTAAKGQRVRPVPMKFCPPNYLMNGITVKTDGKGITGIVSLECRKPLNPTTRKNAVGPDQIRVRLDASQSGVDGFTLFGNHYSLDQKIGNLSSHTGANEKLKRFSCGDYVLSSIEMTHLNRKDMVQFRPKCLPYKL